MVCFNAQLAHVVMLTLSFIMTRMCGVCVALCRRTARDTMPGPFILYPISSHRRL
jgi:hypothetical protein